MSTEKYVKYLRIERTRQKVVKLTLLFFSFFGVITAANQILKLSTNEIEIPFMKKKKKFVCLVIKIYAFLRIYM